MCVCVNISLIKRNILLLLNLFRSNMKETLFVAKIAAGINLFRETPQLDAGKPIFCEFSTSSRYKNTKKRLCSALLPFDDPHKPVSVVQRRLNMMPSPEKFPLKTCRGLTENQQQEEDFGGKELTLTLQSKSVCVSVGDVEQGLHPSE